MALATFQDSDIWQIQKVQMLGRFMLVFTFLLLMECVINQFYVQLPKEHSDGLHQGQVLGLAFFYE
jgi:hypothetical protein